ncbi:MAG: hypothetical protein DMG22_09840 [Acidobacteria bacterium]|nr:MAG: hypothetical protein DMG22_09840 [Acidobacteriota bacterium]
MNLQVIQVALDHALARGYLGTAVRLRTDCFEAIVMEGAAFDMLHDGAAALKALERAHQMRPDNVPVSKLLGQLEISAVKRPKTEWTPPWLLRL